VEVVDLETRLERAAAALALHDETLFDLPVAFQAPPPTAAASSGSRPPLAGLCIACARDQAFSFLYPANLDTLRALGAELSFFSPLADTALPEADALYLPGGYPELHLAELAANEPMKEAIRRHHAAGKPILAECGGMLYLAESLTDAAGHAAAMVGLLPGRAVMQDRLANLGLHSVELPEGTLRGHTFHYSRLESPTAPLVWSEPTRGGGRRGEPVYRLGRFTASYLHLYFPSNPAAVARLLAPSACRRFGGLPVAVPASEA
jgi:cobyrinic acid a,c-diamide synthase